MLALIFLVNDALSFSQANNPCQNSSHLGIQKAFLECLQGCYLWGGGGGRLCQVSKKTVTVAEIKLLRQGCVTRESISICANFLTVQSKEERNKRGE